MSRSPRYTGIIPPLVTPLGDRNTLDVEGLQRLIEHVLAGGVHGLFILGTTGEGPSLSHRLQREVIDHACRLVAGRVPVFVGVTDTCFDESLALARYAAERGASAVVVAPPYYFPAGQPELLEYACSVADEMPLPVVFYNMPACTKIGFELDTLHTLLDHRNVAAFKDSSGNMLYFHRALQLVAKHPDKSILIGPEELLAEATLLGGHGGISGGANVFPHLYVQLHHAAARGDLAATRRFHDQVMKVSSSLYTIGRFSSSTIKGIKGALACLGICDDHMAPPLHRFHDAKRDILRQRMESLSDEISAPAPV